jgi:hypothetical protein
VFGSSVPHYLSDIRNIYIKADRFPLMMRTATKKERKQIIFDGRSRDFDGTPGTELRLSMYTTKLQSICAVLTFDPQL